MPAKQYDFLAMVHAYEVLPDGSAEYTSDPSENSRWNVWLRDMQGSGPWLEVDGHDRDFGTKEAALAYAEQLAALFNGGIDLC